jgi:hypothetical protein
MQVQGYANSQAFPGIALVPQMVNTPVVSQNMRLSYNADLMTNLRIQIGNMVAATGVQLYQNIRNQGDSIADGFKVLAQSGDLLPGVAAEYNTLLNLMVAYINAYDRSVIVQREQLDSMRRQLAAQNMNYGKKVSTSKRSSYGKKSRNK